MRTFVDFSDVKGHVLPQRDPEPQNLIIATLAMTAGEEVDKFSADLDMIEGN